MNVVSLICALVVALVLVAGGWSAKGSFDAHHIKALEAEIVQRDTAQLQLQADQRTKEDSYVHQLAAAADAATANSRELARLRAAAHPGRVLVSPGQASDSRQPLPVPGAAHGWPAGGGVLPQAAGRDITNDAYILADAADQVVEECRNALARWPE